MADTIESLVLNLGEKDTNANGIVPSLERDPLLRELAILAGKLRTTSSAQTLASQEMTMKR